MKILVEIAQQTNVHFFKNIIKRLSGRGHEVVVLARDRESTLALLREYGIPHKSISRAARGRLGLLGELAIRTIRMCGVIRRFRPDIIFGRSYSSILAAWLTRRTILIDDDDGEAVGWLNYRIKLMADIISTSKALENKFPKKQVMYSGYKELAYLHPDNFIPEGSILKDLGLMEGERYFILRFTSLQAFHDARRKGMSKEFKNHLIDLLAAYGKVFISTEGDLPAEWRQYQFPLGLSRIHSALYHADLYAGDSGTMASEAAVLGTPAIFMLTLEGVLFGIKELEEKYGLLLKFRHDQENECLTTIKSLIVMKNLKEIWAAKRARMLADKIDVADYYVSLIQNIKLKSPLPRESKKQ